MTLLHSSIRPLAILAMLLASVAAMAGSAAAHFDFLVVNQNGKLVTAGYNDDLTQYSYDAVDNPSGLLRVYEYEIFPSDPGIQATTQGNLDTAFPGLAYGALAAGQPLSFTLLPIAYGGQTANLWYWDGAGAADFEPSVGNSLTLRRVTAQTAVADGGSGEVAGFTIDTTSAVGVAHEHLASILGSDVPGLYLVSLKFQFPGLADSDPVFAVFANGVGEDVHEAGVAWVESNVANAAVPEPAGMILFGIGASCFLAARRWRRR